MLFFQEDLSRLRRKLEKQKKVEVYTDADEILQEEINQYKVKTDFSKILLYRQPVKILETLLTRSLFWVNRSHFYSAKMHQIVNIYFFFFENYENTNGNMGNLL